MSEIIKTHLLLSTVFIAASNKLQFHYKTVHKNHLNTVCNLARIKLIYLWYYLTGKR